MRVQVTVRTKASLPRVFRYLSDFTTTTQWDPNTVSTSLVSGDGGVGTVYVNTSVFRSRQTQLRYVVEELAPNERIKLRGENATVVAVDTISC
ncbi:MAG TPA: SRPBCC family protein, partial [Acidothermaceae bacterium]|nr:SRPBCC family protein [Acidothermaceae bacterium]